MSINNYLNDFQRRVIRNLIEELEIKKAASIHKDIYDNHIGDTEFWQGFANKVTNELLNCGYADKFHLNNCGYYVELSDDVNKVKYNIYKNGDVEGPMEHTPSKGCYVATCVYGSYECPPVWTLRRYRDYKLAQNPFGRVFIKIYYATSPIAVKLFGNQTWFHKLFKTPLDRWVKKLNNEGIENTPYND